MDILEIIWIANPLVLLRSGVRTQNHGLSITKMLFSWDHILRLNDEEIVIATNSFCP